MRGVLTAKEEWAYPDSYPDVLPSYIRLAVAQNGSRGIQFVINSKAVEAHVEVKGDIEYERYQMLDVPVEFNTAGETAQDGHFVIMQESDAMPDYVTRKAPFRVYDCLKPIDGTLEGRNGMLAGYVTLAPEGNLTGNIDVELTITTTEETYRCKVELVVYAVKIPEERFQVTNWFHLNHMADYHQIERRSEKHMEMIRLYARAMRRTRQTHFFICLDEQCISDKKNWTFEFSHLEGIIRIFFEEGFQMMELGYLATREPDYTSGQFNFPLDLSVDLATEEGYCVEVKFLKAIQEFLRKNDWEHKTVFHITDEPDVHTQDSGVIEHRRTQYYMIANLLKRYIPGAKVIEAVKTSSFRGGVDIWVPLTVNYEADQEKFDMLKDLGEEVWAYVCCVPGGYYLNRFLDFDLIRNRILFWGCSRYHFSGYLHWGFNQYGVGMNPFEGTSCPNHTGLGTNFPCGDSYIVYPGEDGPWISMRLEAQKRGIEDCELLNMLKEKDLSVYEKLVNKVFISNKDYNPDAAAFEKVYEELLQALS